MKSVYALLLGGLVLGLLASCGKSNSTSQGANEMSTVCMSQYTGYGLTQNPCNSNAYQNAVGFGPAQAAMQVSPYGYTSTAATQFACGQINYGSNSYGAYSGQTAAVYSPTKGPGCVSAGAIYANGQPVPYTIENTGRYFVPVSAYVNSGSTQVFRTCDANEPCPSGQACRSPLGAVGSSALGICYVN